MTTRIEAQTTPLPRSPDALDRHEHATGAPPPPADLVNERTRDLISKRRTGRMRRRGWVVKRALALADVAGLTLAFVLAQMTVGPDNAQDRFGYGAELLTFVASLPLWLLLARAYGLYDRDEARTDHSSADDLVGIFNVVTVGTWSFFTLSWLTGVASPRVTKLALFWVTAIVLVGFARALARSVCRRTDAYVQNTVIVGAREVGQRVAQKLLQHPEYGVNVAGFVDDHPGERSDGLGDLVVLGTLDDLPDLVAPLDIERVIIAFSPTSDGETLETIRKLNSLDVQVDMVPRLFEVVGPTTTIHGAEGIPLLGLPPARLAWSSLVLKRTMDVALAAIGLVVLAPLLGLIAIAIKLDSRGPVLFQQRRIGRADAPFEILKFRTMRLDADAHKHEVAHLNKHSGGDDRMFKAPGDPRITRAGRVLRRYSLDELPQLWNVLRGDMSLVGPRPLIPEEHVHVDGWAARRLDLKPGMTGLWQVLGRDDIPFGEMVGLDYRYITSWSLWGDVLLMIRTMPAMSRRAGQTL